MPSPKTRGRCVACDKELPNASMGRHLAACLGPGVALHVAMDVGPGTWWMHLAVAPAATLRDLDGFLRTTWLECCGHLSAFEIEGTRFESSLEGSGGYGWGPKARSMAAKTGAALRPGVTFGYEYDFGSTTALRGRVVGWLAPGARNVTLLARNAPIAWPCASCGQPALRVCPHCFEMACGACEAPCACTDGFEDESLPVVNSPRMGVCGYGG